MKSILGIVSFLIGLSLIAQKPMVSLSVDSKNVQIGNPVTFTVKSNVEGNVEIVFPDEFIQGSGTMNGMEQQMDYNSGVVTTIYYFSQNGAFKENGFYSIYAYVKNKKAIYKSNKVNVKVEKETTPNDDEISKKNLKQPVFGIIQRSKTKIYEGEAVVLEAKVYSRLNINMLESYEAFELDGGAESKDINKSGRLLLNRENFRGNSVLTFTYGKQLVFPSSTGKFRIKPFQMSLQYDDGGIFSERIAFTSNSSSLEVIPLPNGAPRDFIGGVGKFDFNYKIDKTHIKQGDVVALEIEVKGIGNLQNISKPILNLPKGVIIYGDPEIKENIEYGHLGAEGSILYTFNLQFLEDGEKEIPKISISYFDPELKKYITKRKEGVSFDIVPSKTASKGNLIVTTNPVKKTSEKLPFMEESFTQKDSFYTSKWFWPTVLSPLIFAFIGGMFISKKNEKGLKVNEKLNKRKIIQSMKSELEEAKQLHLSGEIKASFQKIENALKSTAFIFQPEKEHTNISKNELIGILKEKNISKEIISQINSCLLVCEEARYAFDHHSDEFEKTLKKTEEIIQHLA